MYRANIRLTYAALCAMFGIPEGVEIENIYIEPKRRIVDIILVGPDGTRGLFQVAEGAEIPQIENMTSRDYTQQQPSELYSQWVELQEEREQERQRRITEEQNFPLF